MENSKVKFLCYVPYSVFPSIIPRGNTCDTPISTLSPVRKPEMTSSMPHINRAEGSACTPPGPNNGQGEPATDNPHPAGMSQFFQWELTKHPPSYCIDFGTGLQSRNQGSSQDSFSDLHSDLPGHLKETQTETIPVSREEHENTKPSDCPRGPSCTDYLGLQHAPAPTNSTTPRPSIRMIFKRLYGDQWSCSLLTDPSLPPPGKPSPHSA